MIKAEVNPETGYIGDKFTLCWEFTAPEREYYKIRVDLNGKTIDYPLGEEGKSIDKNKTVNGLLRFKTTKLGENEVKVTVSKKVYGRFVSHWEEIDSKTVKFRAVETQPSKECTKEQFRDSMVNTFKHSKRLLGWYDNKSPIIDVTDTVNKVKSVGKAKLTIFGSDLSKIGIIGPYDEQPPARDPIDIVNGWEKGQEFERMYCPLNGKYYWVIFPCKLEISEEGGGQGGGEGEQGGGEGGQEKTKIPTWLIIVLIMFGLGFLFRRQR